MEYVYPDSFGNEDTKQLETDKIILKRLSQINKENSMPFRTLLKKISMEMQHNLDLANNGRKDSLSNKLQKTSLYPSNAGIVLTTEGKGEITGKLVLYAYSDLHTKKESTKYTLALTKKEYREQCTKTPQCKDCQANGPYSQCQARAIQPIKQDLGSLPLAQYWQYVLAANGAG